MVMCTVTHRDGRTTQLDQVYIRGASVRLFVVPDMLAQAPMCVLVWFLEYRHFLMQERTSSGSSGITRLEVSVQHAVVRPSCVLKVRFYSSSLVALHLHELMHCRIVQPVVVVEAGGRRGSLLSSTLASMCCNFRVHCTVFTVRVFWACLSSPFVGGSSYVHALP